MGILTLAVAVLLVVVSGAIVVFILMQKKRASGLGGSFAGMGAGTGTYYDKNKGRTIEGQLEFWTKVLGAVFMVLTLALNILPSIK